MRPTRFALVQLAKAYRELGEFVAARDRLLQARELPDGEDGYVLVTLAAVLCDLREYEPALEAAQAAIKLDASNPAAQSVASRCMRELVAVLSRSEHMDQEALHLVRAQADELSRLASSSTPEPAAETLRRRRERIVQSRLVPLRGAPVHVSIDQRPAVVQGGRGSVVADGSSGSVVESVKANRASRAASMQDGGWWRRMLRRLRLVGP